MYRFHIGIPLAGAVCSVAGCKWGVPPSVYVPYRVRCAPRTDSLGVFLQFNVSLILRSRSIAATMAFSPTSARHGSMRPHWLDWMVTDPRGALTCTLLPTDSTLGVHPSAPAVQRGVWGGARGGEGGCGTISSKQINAWMSHVARPD